MENTDKINQSIARYWDEYCKIGYFHVIRHFATDRPTIERFLWSLILLVSTLFCCGYIIKLLHAALSYQIMIGFRSQLKHISEIPFPVVTLCPLTKYNKKKFDYGATKEKLEKGEKLSEIEQRYVEALYLICDNKGKDEFLSSFKHEFYSNDFFETIDEVTLNVDDLMEECSWANEVFNCSELFTKIVTVDGVCYSFNILDRSHIFKKSAYFYKNYFESYEKSNNINEKFVYTSDQQNVYPRRSFSTDLADSLVVVLKMSESNIDNECTTKKSPIGFTGTFTNSLEVPLTSRNYFIIEPGMDVLSAITTYMQLTADSAELYSSSSRNCFLDQEKFLKYFKNYQYLNCVLECMTNYTLLRCDCVGYYMIRDHNIKICGPLKKDCVNTAVKEFFKLQSESELNSTHKSYCQCKSTCSAATFLAGTSATDQEEVYFPNKTLKYSAHDEDHDHSTLNVFFRKSYFHIRERKEVNAALEIVAKFGGLVSLFIGISIISVIEIIYFLTLRIGCNKKLYGKPFP